MAVLNLSAHSLDYKETIGGHENENGDWVQGVETWIENYCKCDIVPAGKANVITIPDGSTHNYSYTIYNLPRTCRDFDYGDIILEKFSESLRCSDFIAINCNVKFGYNGSATNQYTRRHKKFLQCSF